MKRGWVQSGREKVKGQEALGADTTEALGIVQPHWFLEPSPKVPGGPSDCLMKALPKHGPTEAALVGWAAPQDSGGRRGS